MSQNTTTYPQPALVDISEAPGATIILISVLLTIGAIAFLVRNMRVLPSTLYARLVLATSILIIPKMCHDIVRCVVVQDSSTAWLSHPSIRIVNSILGYTSTTLFLQAQLQFLKLVSPFCRSGWALNVRPGSVLRVQIVIVFVSLPAFGACFRWSISDASNQETLIRDKLRWISVAWYAIVALSDICIQCILFNYVFLHLSLASRTFKVAYAILITIGALSLVASIATITTMSILNAINPLVTQGASMAIGVYLLSSAVSMEFLRGVVYMHRDAMYGRPKATATHKQQGSTLRVGMVGVGPPVHGYDTSSWAPVVSIDNTAIAFAHSPAPLVHLPTSSMFDLHVMNISQSRFHDLPDS